MKLQMITVFELEPEISASRLSRVFKTKVKTAGRLLATLRPLPRNSFVSANNEYSPFEHFPSLADYLEQRGIDFIPELFEERIDQLIKPAGRPMRRPSFVTPTVD